LRIERWEAGPNRSLELKDAALNLEVNDGEVLAHDDSRAPCQVFNKIPFLLRGMLSMVLRPQLPIIFHTTNYTDQECCISVAASNRSSTSHIRYLTAEDGHRVWTSRGALKPGCAFWVFDSSQVPAHGSIFRIG
jgi:hypothetical protein